VWKQQIMNNHMTMTTRMLVLLLSLYGQRVWVTAHLVRVATDRRRKAASFVTRSCMLLRDLPVSEDFQRSMFSVVCF
jgi:hypothetical protein